MDYVQCRMINNILAGCNRANELIFRFAREAMSLYAGDIHSLLEVRTVNSRLIYPIICIIKSHTRTEPLIVILFVFTADNCTNRCSQA